MTCSPVLLETWNFPSSRLTLQCAALCFVEYVGNNLLPSTSDSMQIFVNPEAVFRVATSVIFAVDRSHKLNHASYIGRFCSKRSKNYAVSNKTSYPTYISAFCWQKQHIFVPCNAKYSKDLLVLLIFLFMTSDVFKIISEALNFSINGKWSFVRYMNCLWNCPGIIVINYNNNRLKMFIKI